MNYAGHEKLRAEVAEVANAMCDLRTTMNEMEQRYSFNADTLPERLVRHPGSVNPVKWWIWPLMRHGNRKIIRTSSSICSVVKR